jgi:SAM-dependent methyltransferase
MPQSIDETSLAKHGVVKDQMVLVVGGSLPLQQDLQKTCQRMDVRCITPDFPPAGTLEADLLREVAHFDFELGGKNEWDGAPTRYASHCLRQLSSTHCREFYPDWAFEPLLHSPQRNNSKPLKVMDIGCGPISILRWGAIEGEISITGVDPLLEMYALVLARHGLDGLPKIRCDREVNGFAEDLDRLLPNETFDVIYTQNSLDHTQQPGLVIENIGRKLAPNGRAVFQVATRKGTRQNWDQLHKTDIYLKKGVLMYAHQHSPERPLLSPASRLHLKHVSIDSPEWLACSLEKR